MLVLPDSDPEGTLGDSELDEAAVGFAREALWTERSELHEVGDSKLFVDVVAPPPRLFVVGAVDFAAQLCEVAKIAGLAPVRDRPSGAVCDHRAVPGRRACDRGVAGGGLRAARPDRSRDGDRGADPRPQARRRGAACRAGSEAFYIGAMGSRRAQARRRERLLAAGLDAELLDRVAAPIGLDLGALTAAETALSIMSEIVALRHGRAGGRLIEARGRIHDVVPA